MKLNTSYYSAIGGRAKNEDVVSMMECRDTVIGIVADGLGGHSCGEIASKLVVNTINGVLGQEIASVSKLREAIETANDAVRNDTRCQTMKSTVAVLWMDRENALAATVGDTRIYQFRKGRIIFQSKDHTVVNMAVLAGEMCERDIRGNKGRNQLMRALGAQDEIKPDIVPLNVMPGDAFLICSDGFWDHVWEEEMLEDLLEEKEACDWLGKMRKRVEAKMAPNGDNHSAVVILIEKTGGEL